MLSLSVKVLSHLLQVRELELDGVVNIEIKKINTIIAIIVQIMVKTVLKFFDLFICVCEYSSFVINLVEQSSHFSVKLCNQTVGLDATEFGTIVKL